MTKLEQLNVFLSERLSEAVKEILDTVSRMMKEYEEETARIMKENDYLKEMLKVTGCSFTETNPGGIPSVLFGKQDSASNLQQEAEPLESLSQQREAKKENTSIKSEHPTPRYPANADSEPETRPTDDTAEPPQCTPLFNSNTVDQDMIDFEFPIKVKVESMNIESHSGDATDNLDASNQSWSPQNWDMFSERSYQNRQGVGLHPYTTEGSRSTETTIQSHPVEFQAAFSYTNRTICNNRLHCTSRYCELQKRTTSKSSPVWQYFSLKEGDCSKAVCLMCKAVISRGVKEYTTSALLKHLRMKHGKC